MLYSSGDRNSPWSYVNQYWVVDEALELANREFGPGGTQAGRRWFYRIRDELVWKTEDNFKKWRRGSRIIQWCDIYFRDPKDATWFNLKKDLSSSQMS